MNFVSGVPLLFVDPGWQKWQAKSQCPRFGIISI